MRGELQRFQNLRDEQQKRFQQARRERETVESLRDTQLREYTRDATRREQRQGTISFCCVKPSCAGI